MHFELEFFIEANNMNHDQSDLGSYCLQYWLPKNMSRREEQTAKVVTGGLRVNETALTSWLEIRSDFSGYN